MLQKPLPLKGAGKMSEAQPRIYKAISEVMADIGAVGKNQRNQQQGFMFRGIDAVMNAINPALIKHHIFVVPEVLEQRRKNHQNRKSSNLFHMQDKIHLLRRGRFKCNSDNCRRGNG